MQTIFLSNRKKPYTVLRTLLRLGVKDPEKESREKGEDAA